MSNEKNNLYEKIQLVSNEVRNISKDMTVGSGSYSYKAVSDIDVTLAVKDAELKHKLVSIPIKQELINSEILRVLDGQKEKITFVDTIKLTLKIVDLENTNDFIEIESFGKGIDSGDKGFGKASTYARKYALLNAYKIATGEDPDADKNKQLDVKKTISEKRIAITNYLEKNNSLLQEVLKYFNIGTLEDMTEANVEAIFKTYSEKKLI